MSRPTRDEREARLVSRVAQLRRVLRHGLWPDVPPASVRNALKTAEADLKTVRRTKEKLGGF